MLYYSKELINLLKMSQLEVKSVALDYIVIVDFMFEDFARILLHPFK